MAPGQACLNINATCTIEETIYGYYPSVPANVFFCALFGLCMIIQIVQGITFRSWSFMIALGVGCLGEAVGYVGRIMLHSNPYDNTGFDIQITCLIIAPAFFSAGIYLTLKHMILTFGSAPSRIPARWYTWIFIGCDLLSLVLQGAGGGIAATADTKSNQDLGNNMMMAGIVWQVFTLLVFGILASDYFSRLYARRGEMGPTATATIKDIKFRLFAAGLVLAFLAIYTRCSYRIAEMAKGWRNPIMQNETDFIVLDGVMNALAVLALTIFHPGYCFPQMQMRNKHLVTDGNFATSKMESDYESNTASPRYDDEAAPPSEKKQRRGIFRR